MDEMFRYAEEGDLASLRQLLIRNNIDINIQDEVSNDNSNINSTNINFDYYIF
jgi:hypothetical protein